MIYFIVVLFGICLLQLIYIKRMRRQLKEWLSDLKEIHGSPCQKLFTVNKGILSDITFELNGILSDDQKQIGQLKKADMANRQMLTSLSHDVRTPLASLIGYLEALDNDLADNPKEYIKISRQKALALKNLTDMLFEWCKISSDEQQYRVMQQDVNELTREILIEWIPIMERKKVELKTDIPDDEFLIDIDDAAYKRIINNLINNAIYHGNCSVISVSVIKKETVISISVSNNGVPIPQDKLPFIFERLYKCDDARSETGSGLGLSIAKELVLAMDGEIKVTSSMQETVFIIDFPGKPNCKDVRKK
ncbi:MAG: HAMP domain-containing histidine kinase [Clostridium sp.]|nr:HAMP domain-containing histidine kinase [Acetatifactor muris]MCM1527035.1 HAMP domain-containing histidine kinase [Bacteroides sp.]MCM1562012.1 HAMP domain-containing histidine kinase [Clostridium sp.]